MANETKWTPGPWHYDGMAGVPLPLAKNDYGQPVLMVRGRGASVAEVVPQDNAEANARLIAKAPAMYLLLRRLTEAGAIVADSDVERIVDEARSILAAIEGK